jgi:uncharacterized protein DUF4440
MSQLTDEILALEKGFWTQTHNPRFFEENMVEGGISVIEPIGFIEKDQAVQMAGDKPFQDVELRDVHIQQLTPDCVILAYHGQGQREGQEKPFQGSIASTYVLRDGRWQLALTAHQPWKPNGKKAS